MRVATLAMLNGGTGRGGVWYGKQYSRRRVVATPAWACVGAGILVYVGSRTEN